MWKLLGYGDDDKNADSVAAPQQLTMVRSRAVRNQQAEKEGASGGQFVTCEFKSHGIRLDYPKDWSVVEEERKIIFYSPSDRNISINLIIGVVAFGTDLDDLTTQAVEMPRKLMAKGVLDPSSLPLEVVDFTMLGRPARSFTYKVDISGKRKVEQSWTENRGRSFIVTRSSPEKVYATHKPTFDRLVQSLAFLSKEAEEYEPPAEERKRAARLRRGQPGQFTSHESMYLSKPGVLIYTTFEDCAKRFRVRYPGIFEPDNSSGDVFFKLSLRPKNAKPEEKKGEETDKEAKQRRLRESLEAVRLSVTVNALRSEGDHVDHVRRLAIGAEVSSAETKLAGQAARKLTYRASDDGQVRQHTDVLAVKYDQLYIVSLSHPYHDTQGDSQAEAEAEAESEAHAYFFGHILRQFEFIEESTPSKASMALYQNHTTHPKIAIEFPQETFQIQPNMGGPFLVTLVHFADQEEDDPKGKGKAKGRAKPKVQDPKTPTSMVGLIVSPLPELSDKTVWNLDKFGTMIKNQLRQKGGNCRILSEGDVTITNGRMKGREIIYVADAQQPGGPQQGMNKGLAMQQMRCVQRAYLFGTMSYVLLFQAMDAAFDEEWALAEPVISSFQFFSS